MARLFDAPRSDSMVSAILEQPRGLGGDGLGELVFWAASVCSMVIEAETQTEYHAENCYALIGHLRFEIGSRATAPFCRQRGCARVGASTEAGGLEA